MIPRPQLKRLHEFKLDDSPFDEDHTEDAFKPLEVTPNVKKKK